MTGENRSATIPNPPQQEISMNSKKTFDESGINRIHVKGRLDLN
jgi:hypothetical protein